MKVVLATLLLGGLAFGQAADNNIESVAAAAQKSRGNKTVAAKKVYTDDDMPSTNGSAGPKHDPPAVSTPYNDPVRDQKTLDAEWKQRIQMQKDTISSLEQQVKIAEDNASHSSHYYTVKPNPNYARYKEQADNLREQLENAKKELIDLQDEAHKAGANKAYD